MPEIYFEQGENRKDCELKIAEKYKRPFQILSEKQIRTGGFLGLGSKSGIQVEFYFTPAHYKYSSAHAYNQSPWHISDNAENKARPFSAAGASSTSDLEEEKRKFAAMGRNYNAAVSGREASQQILDSLNELKEKIAAGGRKDEHSSFTRAAELLRSNDFSENYINTMLERLRKEMSLETLDDFDAVQDHLLEWIGESINIYKDDANMRKPAIMVLVGPTGVGKTTTIAKLAAIYGIGTEEIKPVDVRMITIDQFRICAKEQLETMGNIMQIEVSCVVNKQALRKEIAIHSEDTDLFLIDTIGNSPKDLSKLGEMKEILDGAGRSAQYHLAISASTKTSDIEDILRQFEPFNYKSVVLTKMDETGRIGNIISALAEKKKCISYITEGQIPPAGIRKASVVRFLINLEGFKVDREKIEKQFPCGEADQIMWR